MLTPKRNLPREIIRNIQIPNIDTESTARKG